jgi:hypothetical protein
MFYSKDFPTKNHDQIDLIRSLEGVNIADRSVLLSRSIHEIPFNRHPIDDIEAEVQNIESYRRAAMTFKNVMEVAQHFVVQSERPRMAMQRVGIALSLRAPTEQSETELALLNQVTRQDLSKA